ncbi:MAG TPA: alpha/beta fold hydrolase BchO [Methylibium sp.]|uniref:alpha/beta fold hydrolase BchO n=1 Tax=Methylibium sp. TaxID=2067992 RepID=UPI002DB9903C|nr:alpha/beta fold hydrolase BchO [Methylibium sp.]HEU4457695.1 alpha/beta fold hydrolase BchO [Methylibium sp.]
MSRASTEDLVWDVDGRGWPLAEHSRFVEAAGLRWHLQRLGPANAPRVLLLHGTGASTHSWREVAPALALRHEVLAIDLPGHAFTSAGPPGAHTLPGMAAAIAALLRTIDFVPASIVGHSAGAAVAVRMALDGLAAPRAIVSFNGALLPFGGLAGRLFMPAARLLASQPLVPKLFAAHSRDRRVVQRLVGSTGSRLDEQGFALYARLVRSPAHAAGALAMMARWDLRPLERDLPGLAACLHLVAAERDRTVPPTVAQRVRARLPQARLVRWNGLGHLAHEEAPERAAALIEAVSKESA